jgi:hypothetical protein
MKRLRIFGCAGLVILFAGAIFPAVPDEGGPAKKDTEKKPTKKKKGKGKDTKKEEAPDKPL